MIGILIEGRNTSLYARLLKKWIKKTNIYSSFGKNTREKYVSKVIVQLVHQSESQFLH